MKAVSGIMLTLLLVGMLTLEFNIQPVKAEDHSREIDANNQDRYPLVNPCTFSEPPTTQWNKTYGGPDFEGVGDSGSVQQTTDGGYIVAGITQSFGAGHNDLWLVKTDIAGTVAWSRTYGGSGDDRADSVQQTTGGGYIIAGETNSFGAGGYDFWLVKTNANGNMQWNKTYGGAGYDWGHCVQQTSDGGYIIAGGTESFGAGGKDFWLVKTDDNGNMQWNRTYGGASHDYAFPVRQTSDGGYIIAGYTGSFGAGGWDFWLVKTDANGIMEWNKTYGGTDVDCAFSVQQTSDGGYIIAGYTCSFGAGGGDVWLIKLGPTPPPYEDLAVNITWISNNSPLEGETVTINVTVTNKGNVVSGSGSVELQQHINYTYPIDSPFKSFTLSKKELLSIEPGESKNFSFTWYAVEIVNVDPTKRLSLNVFPLRDANPENNVAYIDLELNDTSGFNIREDTFSFQNWEAELEVLLPSIESYLSAFTLPSEEAARLVYFWMAHGGHCHGMAAASAVFYKHSERKPVQKETFDMLKEEVAPEIGFYQVEQVLFEFKLASRVLFGMNLREEYAKILENLHPDKDQPVIMGICSKGEGGKTRHAVTVFNIYEVSDDTKNIVAYDNEYPGMAIVFTFDLKNNAVYCPIHDQSGSLYSCIEAVYVDAPGPYPVVAAKRWVNNFWQGLRDIGKRIKLLKCPVNVTVTDEFGRMISETENQIPGASFEQCNLTHIKIFYLPLNLTYHVQLNATDYGNSTISQITPTESVYETAFSQATFDLTSETVADFDLLPYDANYTLRVDENGDGSIDYELTPEVETLTTEYDIGIAEIVPSKTVIGQGYNLTINTTIMNYGAHTETFNVTIYANTTLVASQNVTLPSGDSKTLTTPWNTTGVAKGNYTIKAHITPVPGETDTTDNTLTDGWVLVTIPGDVDGNGIVEIKDMVYIALAYGCTPGQLCYDPNLDINCDGIIDIKDIVIAALHYGETWQNPRTDQ